MTESSWIEKISSNIVVKGSATSVAVLGTTVTPLAAFVPFLVDSLASGRQARRLEEMFNELQRITEENAENLKNVTDDQYKVINESIAAAFYTIEQDKIDILKRAAINAFADPETVNRSSDALSRVVRDISAVEAEFVIRNFGCDMFQVANEVNWSEKAMAIKPGSNDEITLSGLINLGLLYSKTSSPDFAANRHRARGRPRRRSLR